MPVWDQLVAGFGAGAVTTLCLHPLDLVKTRMQLQYHAKTTTWSELVSIHRQRGLRGLYQGFSANLAGGTASWGFYFMWYNYDVIGYISIRIYMVQVCADAAVERVN